jgi:hypothetical protein
MQTGIRLLGVVLDLGALLTSSCWDDDDQATNPEANRNPATPDSNSPASSSSTRSRTCSKTTTTLAEESGREPLYPRPEPFQKELQSLLQGLVGNAAVGVDHSVLQMQIELGLSHHEHLLWRENVAQMLLRGRSSGLTCRCTEHCRGLADPAALPRRSRAPVDRVLEHRRHRAVVLRRHEDHTVGSHDLALHSHDGRGRIFREIDVEQRQVIDLHSREFESVCAQSLERARESPIDRARARTADDDRDRSHVLSPW